METRTGGEISIKGCEGSGEGGWCPGGVARGL